VLSPGGGNVQRDRQAKLNLYSYQGVLEYWIADWQARQIEIYRPASGLTLVATLNEYDGLTSTLLPSFSCNLSSLFIDLI
jgi:Uma2 family endonuclease